MGKKSLSVADLLSADLPNDALAALSFEEGLKLLDELVQKVESGALSLDSAIQSYERGLQLMERLRSQLQRAEERLQLLEKGSNGAKGSQ